MSYKKVRIIKVNNRLEAMCGLRTFLKLSYQEAKDIIDSKDENCFLAKNYPWVQYTEDEKHYAYEWQDDDIANLMSFLKTSVVLETTEHFDKDEIKWEAERKKEEEIEAEFMKKQKVWDDWLLTLDPELQDKIHKWYVSHQRPAHPASCCPSAIG